MRREPTPSKTEWDAVPGFNYCYCGRVWHPPKRTLQVLSQPDLSRAADKPAEFLWRGERTDGNICRKLQVKWGRMTLVYLRDVVEALDLESDELHSYLDPETGEIITFNEEEARIAESGQWDTAPEWMQGYLPKVKRALEDDRMLELPDRAHIDEWRMMQDFAAEQEQCRCRPELLSAIHGSGAFRRFKNAIQQLGLEDSWYKYRQAAFEQVARAWLEENQIPYR